MPLSRLVLGTRGSPLALQQTAVVVERLRAVAPGISLEVRTIRTAGDRHPTAAVSELSPDGVFVRALEEALLDGTVDAAVHSLKDLPGMLLPNLVLAAFLPRGQPGDAFVSLKAASIEDLPRGALVGTGSARRRALLLDQRPDLRIEGIRGNVGTRLRKLREGRYDALVLALAGLERLGLQQHVRQHLPPEHFVPAPGQGTVTVEARADREDVLALLRQIDDGQARTAAQAERSFLVTLAGGCLLPAGVYASRRGARLRVVGVLADSDGRHLRRRAVEGPPEDAAALGARLARTLMRASRRFGAQTPEATPLAGQTVLVTRPHGQAGELMDALMRAGARPLAVPAIEIVPPDDWAPLDQALARLRAYRWLVLNSVNGVDAVVARARRHPELLAALRQAQVAAVGARTAAALRAAGIDVAFVPADQRAEVLAGTLPHVMGARVLVVRGDRGLQTLARGLRARGARVDEVVAYRTVSRSPKALERELAGERIDWLVFASGSAVRAIGSLPEALQHRLRAARVACIGPETAAQARAAGFEVAVTARQPDAAALVDSMIGAPAEAAPAGKRGQRVPSA
jgi:hydroxymethylbilane synthase